MGLVSNDRTFREHITWFTTVVMVIFHLGAIAALFRFSWKALALAGFLWWVFGSLGIGLSYHRLLTRRGYKTYTWLAYFLSVWCTLALEGGSLCGVWVHGVR